MKSKDIGEAIVLIFETGDEVISELTRFAKERHITAARFTAIGAFRDVGLGYFDWQTKKYLRNQVDDQVEVVSLTGDIALDGEKPVVHAHVVIGKRDGSAMGGHLLEAHVRPTLELILEKSPAHLQKKLDPESGLALIAL
jgi:predicted DNA-binding protein with PD1-like motif